MQRSSILTLSMLVLMITLLGLILHPFSAVKASVPTSTYQLNGLSAPVTISYDVTGMAHILASNEQAVYLGLCFAVARDRLFQLDELRRAAEGRLAELFGAGPNNAVLEQDELFRTFGLVQLAQTKFAAATPTVQADLAACALGINFEIGLAEAHQSLPPEFIDLGYTPEQWKPWQSELIALYFSISLDSNVYLAKLERASIMGLAGSQVAAALMPDPPDAPSLFDKNGNVNLLGQFLAESAPTNTSRTNTASKEASSVELAMTIQRLAPLEQVSALATALLGGDRASNNFAVDGYLTASGKPLLANDPHLQLGTPSLLYLAQITVSGSNGFSFEGLTLPGFPAFFSGHNQAIAYGVTTANLDDTDLYVETTRQTVSGEQVLFHGQWVPVQSRLETFQVAGASPVTLTVQVTPHGPILNAAMPSLDTLGELAFKDTESQAAWSVDGFFALPKATNWQTFRAGLASESTGLNFLFADNAGANGHIGYQLAGLAPQRDMENTLVPVAGADGTHEWSGYATFDQLPSVYNPPQHILETSNNRIVPDEYAPGGIPVYLTRYEDEPLRAERAISLLLQAGNHLAATNLTQIQLDTQTMGLPIAADLVAAVNRAGLPSGDPNAATSLATLGAWDGNASAASIGATIYETVVAVLDRDAVTQLLGPGSYQAYTQVFITTQILALQSLLEAPRAPFFGAATDAQAATARDQAASLALGETDALLRAALGTDTSTWTWGALHTLTYNHPLASVDARFFIGSFPSAGDGETINTGGWFMELGLLSLPPTQLARVGGAQAVFQQDALANARIVWDMAHFDDSLGVISTGESGNPTSPHWSDQATLWREGQYNRLAFSAPAYQINEIIVLT